MRFSLLRAATAAAVLVAVLALANVVLGDVTSWNEALAAGLGGSCGYAGVAILRDRRRKQQAGDEPAAE